MGIWCNGRRYEANTEKELAALFRWGGASIGWVFIGYEYIQGAKEEVKA